MSNLGYTIVQSAPSRFAKDLWLSLTRGEQGSSGSRAKELESQMQQHLPDPVRA